MRLAYVVADSGVPVFGTNGSSSHVQSVLTALLAAGATPELFASRFEGEPPAALAGLRRIELPRASRRLPAAERERRAFAANTDLAAALVARGPYDLVYERQSLWSSAAMTTAAAAGLPGLLEVNAPLLEETRRYRQLVDQAAAERQVRRAFSAAGAILAVSRGVARYVERFAEARGKIHLVRNGVDPARFAVAGARPSTGAPCTLGFVGSLRPWHGVDRLIEALALVRERGIDVRLRIVGRGPEQPALARLAERLGVAGAIAWTGAVPPARVPFELAAMDIAAAPYPDLDDFYFSPLKLFEYMAAGLPVVASSIGDLPEIVTHGRTGWLCRPGDVGDLAAAVMRLAADPALRRRLGSAARRQVEERHGWDGVARQILAIARQARPVAGRAVGTGLESAA